MGPYIYLLLYSPLVSVGKVNSETESGRGFTLCAEHEHLFFRVRKKKEKKKIREYKLIVFHTPTIVFT